MSKATPGRPLSLPGSVAKAIGAIVLILALVLVFQALLLWLLPGNQSPVATAVWMASAAGFLPWAIPTGARAGTWVSEYFSPWSRAERARDAGRLGEALQRYVRAYGEDRSGVDGFFSEALPYRSVRTILIDAAWELCELERSAALARAAGVPVALTARLVGEAQAAGSVLWRSADRVGAVAAQRCSSLEVARGLGREAERLTRVYEAVLQVRGALAELTLSGTGGRDLESAELRLRAVAQALAQSAQELG